VKTQIGFHIIKTEGRKTAATRTLEEAKAEIKDKLIKERAAEAALHQAERMALEAALTQNLGTIAQKSGLIIQSAGFFSAEQALTDLGLDNRFSTAALALKKGEISALVPQENGHYLIKCLERQESRLPSLDEAKAKVEEDLTQEKADQMAKSAAEAFIAKAEKGVGWDKATADLKAAEKPITESNLGEKNTATPPADPAQASKSKPVLDTTGPFDREGRIPKIGGDRNVQDAAFSLTAGQVFSQPIKGEGGYYAIHLKEKFPAADADFEKEKDNLIQRLQSGKGQNNLQGWLQAIKAAAQIHVEDGVL
ncbi:MAG: peptidyl-prolyl cis-trans isomerase, partial [Deltaproteobacteria bacterium]|nr:peptidyl-prolyl cis-trans isomerase [Deltaproteobacteria bacterium]